MPHVVTLITDDRNRVRAQCRCTWRSPWITPDAQSRPRQHLAERIATHHVDVTARQNNDGMIGDADMPNAGLATCLCAR